MNNSNAIENGRIVGGDYFYLKKAKRSKKYLKDFIHLFNFDDYWCYKNTNRQRLVNEQEFLDFKNSGYVFFKKELYDINKIEQWIEWMKSMGGIQYLVKPLPPFNPNNVIIREEKQDET
jgi:hypothetical protein